MKSENIIIIDYGTGNIGSIQNMLKYIGVKSRITRDISDIEKADKLILSGVGAFDSGMKNINDAGLKPLLYKKVFGERVPILGICLGMQLFTKNSEEGKLPGLGWIEAETVRFKFNGQASRLKVPHMGWNLVNTKKPSVLFQDMYEEPRFYFVHSYHVVLNNRKDLLCSTHYGYDFGSALECGNIYGVQFHPEKSHKFGIKLLRNFAELV